MSSLQWGKEKEEDKPLDKQALINHMFSDKYRSGNTESGNNILAENVQCIIILACLYKEDWKPQVSRLLFDDCEKIVSPLKEEILSSKEIYEPIVANWESCNEDEKRHIQTNSAAIQKDMLLGYIVDLENLLVKVRSNMPESAKGLLSRDPDIDALLFMCKYLPEIKNKVKLGE